MGTKPRPCAGPLPLSQGRKELCQASDLKVGAARRLDKAGPVGPRITVLKRQKPETRAPLGHMEFPNLF